MMSASVVLILGALAICPINAVFLNNQPFPTYSLENMPDTQFSCREKILGGYYADPDTQCQMFHVCVKVAGIGIQDYRFLCPNGTAFDQDHQICADWEDVDCDSTTLYYSSDNFDLYRVGSGFESKAHKYGEDEETFALQRAETGDARLNRDQQVQVVNQQKDNQRSQPKRVQNQEKDIFKGSSSSNFFNNRNNGKENDDDYDDNVNVNQNRDYEQRRKVIRKPQRATTTTSTTTLPPSTTTQEYQTRRPARPTGFANNFAGSFAPTSSPVQFYSTPNTPKASSFRIRGPRPKVTQSESATPTYTVSTPAPFRKSPAQTENYPSNNPQYSKTSPLQKQSTPKKTDYYKPTTFSPSAKPFSFNTAQQSFPTTFAPRTQEAYSQLAQQTSFNTPKASTFHSTTTRPTTYTQYTPTVPRVSQTTVRSNRYDETQYDDGSYDSKYDYDNNKGEDEFLKTAHSQNIASSRNELNKAQKQQSQKTTFDVPKTTLDNFQTTQYTQKPYDVPKTTQYYQKNYNVPKTTQQKTYDVPKTTQNTQKYYESLKTTQYTQKSYDVPKTTQATYQAPETTQYTERPSVRQEYTQRSYDVPRTTQKSYDVPKATQKAVTQSKAQAPAKKVKDVSYDYAYYDSFGAEPDYEIDTEVKKTVKN